MEAAEPAFVPLSILPEPMDQPQSPVAEATVDCIGVMTIEVGPDGPVTSRSTTHKDLVS